MFTVIRNVSDKGKLQASSYATIPTSNGPCTYGHFSKQILKEILLPLISVALVISGNISLTFFLKPRGTALILTFSEKLSSCLDASGSDTWTSIQRSESATVPLKVTCMFSSKPKLGSPNFLPSICGASARGQISTTNI